MFKTGKIILAFWLFYTTAKAQLIESNWVFGDSLQISFYPNPVVSTGRGLFGSSGKPSASISDKNGNLLFYVGSLDNVPFTNPSYRIWDSNNNLFLNGDSILGYSGSYQGCIIVPFALDSNKYFILTMELIQGVGCQLYKSILDLQANMGNGAVTSKNVKVSDSIFHIPVWTIKHGNGRDWWVLLHTMPGNGFVRYLLSNDSLSYFGHQYIGNNTNGYVLMRMNSNRYGNKLALSCGTGVLDLFDFDRCSGLLSNWISLADPPYNTNWSYYGTAFSEDNTKLYVTKRKTTANSYVDSLFQFDLSVSNIPSTRTLIFSTDSLESLGDLLLGIDGKIYVANMGYFSNFNNFDSLNMHMGVIEYPNNAGTACNFSPYSFYLGGRRSFGCLPLMPNYELGPFIGSGCDSLTSAAETEPLKCSAFIYPNPAASCFSVCSEIPFSSPAWISVTDLNGAEHFRERIPSQQHEITLDASALRPGIYVIEIFSNSSLIKTQKLVVIHGSR